MGIISASELKGGHGPQVKGFHGNPAKKNAFYLLKPTETIKESKWETKEDKPYAYCSNCVKISAKEYRCLGHGDKKTYDLSKLNSIPVVLAGLGVRVMVSVSCGY